MNFVCRKRHALSSRNVVAGTPIDITVAKIVAGRIIIGHGYM